MDLSGGNIAVLGAVCAAAGAIFGKLIDWAMSSDSSISKDQNEIRKELREDVVRLGDRLSTIVGELDDWREKYYELLEKCAQVKAEHAKLKLENSAIKEKVIKLESKIASINGG